MSLRTAALGMAVVVACRSAEHPPDEGGVKAGEWRVREVPECGFTVEMPDHATRTDLTMPEYPDVIEVAYLTRGGLSAECTVYPPAMELPPPPELLRTMFERAVRHSEGLGGGITDRQLTVDETGSTATYTIRFANGVLHRGRMMVVGRQVHELTAGIGSGRSTEAELARLIASYMRK